jgi:hypothetical protein
MVRHWHRTGGAGARRSLVINAVGAAATGATLVIVLISKLVEGAWVSVLLVTAMMVLFKSMHAHYLAVDAQTEKWRPLDPAAIRAAKPPIMVVPIGRWNVVAAKAVELALRLSPEVRAVQVLGAESDSCQLDDCWEKLVKRPLQAAGMPAPQLDVVRSRYRRLFRPLLSYIERLRDEHPEREIAVVVPELVQRRWYQTLLHTHRATILKALLLLKGGPRVVVINAPWYLRS